MAVSRYRRDSTPRHRTTTDQVPTPEWRREHRPTLLTETGEKRVRKEFMSEAVGPRTRALTEAPPQMRRARRPRRVWRRLGLGFAIVKARNDASRPRRWFLDHHRASNNNCDVSFSSRQGQVYLQQCPSRYGRFRLFRVFPHRPSVRAPLGKWPSIPICAIISSRRVQKLISCPRYREFFVFAHLTVQGSVVPCVTCSAHLTRGGRPPGVANLVFATQFPRCELCLHEPSYALIPSPIVTDGWNLEQSHRALRRSWRGLLVGYLSHTATVHPFAEPSLAAIVHCRRLPT